MPRRKSAGRPKGTTGARKTGKAVAITLKPRHEQIATLHLAGYDNTEIANYFGISAQTVSNTLGDPRVVALIDAGKQQLKRSLLGDIEGNLIDLAHKSIDNLRETVEAKISPLHPMKRHQDQLGLDLLSRIGFGEVVTVRSGGRNLSEGAAKGLAAALEKAQKAEAVNVETGEVIEATLEESENESAA